MGSTKEVYQFLAFLALSVIIQECHAESVNLSAPETFIRNLFDEFGSNNSMNSQQFNSLLKELNIGSSSHEEHEEHEEHEHASENGKPKVRAKKRFHCFHDEYSSQHKYLLICLPSSPVSYELILTLVGSISALSSLKPDLRP